MDEIQILTSIKHLLDQQKIETISPFNRRLDFVRTVGYQERLITSSEKQNTAKLQATAAERNNGQTEPFNIKSLIKPIVLVPYVIKHRLKEQFPTDKMRSAEYLRETRELLEQMIEENK